MHSGFDGAGIAVHGSRAHGLHLCVCNDSIVRVLDKEFSDMRLKRTLTARPRTSLLLEVLQTPSIVPALLPGMWRTLELRSGLQHVATKARYLLRKLAKKPKNWLLLKALIRMFSTCVIASMCIHIYIYMHEFVSICLCISTSLCTYFARFVYVHLYMYMYTCIYVCMYINMHATANAYVHVNVAV